MSNLVPIKAGSRIKIPAYLIARYENEWQIANNILKQKREKSSQPSVRQGDNRYSLQFRHEDLSKFTRKKDLLRYIKTTHEIVTGKYFLRQISQYRSNLLASALKNFGVPVQGESITIFNINKYDSYLTQNQKDILTTLATMTREEIADMEGSSDLNLVQYQYLPEQYQDEHEDKLIYEINAVFSRLYGQEDAFSEIQAYRRKRGL